MKLSKWRNIISAICIAIFAAVFFTACGEIKLTEDQLAAVDVICANKDKWSGYSGMNKLAIIEQDGDTFLVVGKATNIPAFSTGKISTYTCSYDVYIVTGTRLNRSSDDSVSRVILMSRGIDFYPSYVSSSTLHEKIEEAYKHYLDQERRNN